MILGILGSCSNRLISALCGRGGGVGPSALLLSSTTSSTEYDLSRGLKYRPDVRISGEEIFLKRRADFGDVGILSSLNEDSDSLRFSNFLILLSKPRLIIRGDFGGCCTAVLSRVSGSESEDSGLVLRAVLGAGIGAIRR